ERAYLVASHALILENTCSGGGGGGGMYFRAEHINFKNSIVALNECGGGGGGGGIYADSTSGSIVNNTLDRNHASDGGNVYVSAATSLTFKNNLVTYGSQYGFQAASMDNVTYSYNDCYGNTPADYDEVVPDTTNISRSPFYADTTAFNYYLLVHSGGIDTGDPSVAADPDGSRADQGAYGGASGYQAAPEYVKNLAAAVMSDTTIQLTWDQASGAASYAVYGSQTSGFAPEQSVCLGSVADPTITFLHEPVGGCWYYRVSAANALGYGGGYSSEDGECAVGPDLIAPTVEVVYPNGGESIEPGDTIEVKWLASDNKQVDSVSIYYSSNAGTDYNLIVQGCTADSTYEWIAPEISSDSCLVRVVAYDPSLNAGVDASDSLFSIKVATGVDDTPVPCFTSLNQNYPNPFNPSTRISYSLKAATRVSLRIYNISGRLVRVLVDSTEPMGAHEAVWNGKDNTGRSVASGIYFYRLDAGAFSATRKMVLIR
ncbi:MAG: T9SS type A sorting domain-containing protein, partial [Candidatus Krumholzibacteria bacterium]|nr:T9SS type A sorting domain-containing protein [Candidatus Krumholzibacteria bacterium]